MLSILLVRPEGLLHQADVAMYEAKHKGKAHHEVFEPRMNTYSLKRLKLESNLRRAIESEEFRVHYQPKFSRETGRIVCVEALVRWKQPKRGLVSPGKFIPLAEETGLLIHTSSGYLMRPAGKHASGASKYPSDPPLKISVNLSARQVQDPDLIQDDARALQETGLDPGGLILELTESVVMYNARSTTGTLRELKALGVELVIDDFGTGYSSLSYFKRFPVEQLKSDRSFVDGLGEDPEDTVLMSGMISLVHALG